MMDNVSRGASGFGPDIPGLPGEESEVCRAVRAAVDRLPQRQREAVLLRYWQRLSYANVAEQMGAPLGTVGVLLHRAQRTLRASLRDLCP